MSPVATMFLVIGVGIGLSLLTKTNVFWLFVFFAPLAAVMMKRREDRKVQKEQTELLRQIAGQQERKSK